MMELLKVEHLFAGYGKEQIVKDISLSVRAGEVAGVFGENGCGKTTLLKGIAGLGTRMCGNVCVDGRDVTKLTAKERARYLSMFSAESPVPDGLLAEEVLEMGWYCRLPFLQRPDFGLKQEKVQVIREMELEPLIFQYFDRLSQGQKQRVLLGRMLLQNAPVFLLDEPDNTLDFKHKHALLMQLRTMARKHGKAGLLISHDPSLVLTYCDRVFLMKEGMIKEMICPQEENETEIARKLEQIIGKVRVTKRETSVIIFP